jgi:hypothetical protein
MSIQTNADKPGAIEATADAKTGSKVLPDFVRPNFEGMPAELKALKNWVLWVPIWNGSKWTKRPIQVSGFPASTTNPNHWSFFDQVKQTYERGFIELRDKKKPSQNVPIGGIGFVFDGRQDEDGFVYAGIDFDKVSTSDDIASLARERIERLGSYVEASVSGHGLHVIVKAKPLQTGLAHDGTEIYTSKRYFTMTGHAGGVTRRIIAAPDEFAALAEELDASCRAKPKAATPPASYYDLNNFKNVMPSPVFAAWDPADSLSNGLEPDIDEIRAAAAAIPPSALATEPEWMKVARAFAHEAAVYKDYTEPLWEVLEEVSRSAPGYNQEENRCRFERYIREAFPRKSNHYCNSLRSGQ